MCLIMFFYPLDVLYNDCYELYKQHVNISNPTIECLHSSTGYKYNISRAFIVACIPYRSSSYCLLNITESQ